MVEADNAHDRWRHRLTAPHKGRAPYDQNAA
jgi:hypothetical protein